MMLFVVLTGIVMVSDEGHAVEVSDDSEFRNALTNASVDQPSEVTLSSNIKLNSAIYTKSNSTITLNLKGYSITPAEGWSSSTFIANNGTLIINGPGTIDSSILASENIVADTTPVSTIANNKDRSLIVNDGVVLTGGFNYTLNNNGIAEINGSTIKAVSSLSGNGLAITTTTISTTEIIDSKIQSNGICIENNGLMSISGDETEITSSKAINNKSGSLTISGGKIVGTETAIMASVGEVKITGGEISSSEGNNCITTVASGTGDEPAFSIQGGSFSSDVSNFCKSGYTSSRNPDGSFGITIDTASGYTAVASIGTEDYASLPDAFEQASDEDIIVLNETVTECPRITIDDGRKITLNLNENSLYFQYKMNFTVKHGGLVITGTGTVSEQVTSDGDRFYYAPVTVYGSVEDVSDYTHITIGKDVKLVGWSGLMIDCVESGNSKYGYGIVVDLYGTLESKHDIDGYGGHGVYINGQIKATTGNTPIINIYDDAKITSFGNGIYAAGYANWNIYGGSITASDALSIKSGTFDISGGTITSNGEYADPATANSNGSENTGAAVSITSNDGYAKSIELNIMSGTFTSQNGYALYEGIAQKGDGSFAAQKSFASLDIKGGTFTGAENKGAVNITTATNKNVISGGTFSTDVSEYCTENLVTISEDGKFVTKAGHTVTFKSSDGTETVVRVPNGEAVEPIPTQTATEAGYAYAWTVDDYAWDFDSPITYDVTLVETLTITDLSVDIEYGTDENGDVTFTAIPNSALELEYTYIWMYQGDESYTDTKQTITNQGVGGYSVTVTGKDANEVMGLVSVIFTYRMLLPDQGEPSEEPEEFDITHSGQDVSRDVMGSTIAIVSSGNHTDVDLSLNFTEGMSKVAGLDINANVGGGALQIKMIKVDASEIAEENAPSGAIVEDAVAVDVTVDTRITDYSMIVKIPVQTKNGQYLRTVATYYTDGNGRTGEVQGRIVAVNEEYSEVWIYTDGNTQYTAVPLTYTDEPYSDPEPSVNPEPETPDQPVIDTDDETLPPIFIPGGSGTTGTSGDDDTVTIVACAAAAVVAALMAVFLILTYRKD